MTLLTERLSRRKHRKIKDKIQKEFTSKQNSKWFKRNKPAFRMSLPASSSLGLWQKEEPCVTKNNVTSPQVGVSLKFKAIEKGRK